MIWQKLMHLCALNALSHNVSRHSSLHSVKKDGGIGAEPGKEYESGIPLTNTPAPPHVSDFREKDAPKGEEAKDGTSRGGHNDSHGEHVHASSSENHYAVQTDSHEYGLDDMPTWLLTHVHFVMVDTTTHDYLTSMHDVRCLPTFVAYESGQIIGRVEGAHEREFHALIRLYHAESGE